MRNKVTKTLEELKPEYSAKNARPLAKLQTRERALWVCSLGHEWETTLALRKRGTGCPVCNHKVILPGFNDLATTHPHLVRQYSDRNEKPIGEMKHRDKVWWQCETEQSHVWKATILNRKNLNHGCPYCSKRLLLGKTSELFPHLVSEWHESNPCTLDEARSFASYKFICQHGHIWEALLTYRKNGFNCPYCSGLRPIVGETDLATTHPHLVPYWLPGNDKSPTEVTAGSNYVVQWVCHNGHEHKCSVKYKSSNPDSCPICAGRLIIAGVNDLATTHPHLLKEWSYEDNEITPEQIGYGSGQKVAWKCLAGDSHPVWWRSPNSRTGNTKTRGICPKCWQKRSAVEKSIFDVLKGDDDLWENNVPLEVKVGRRAVRSVDMLHRQLKVVVEYDGSYWHANRKRYDTAKTRALLDAGYKVIRIREEPLFFLDIKDAELHQIEYDYSCADIDGIVKKIKECL